MSKNINFENKINLQIYTNYNTIFKNNLFKSTNLKNLKVFYEYSLLDIKNNNLLKFSKIIKNKKNNFSNLKPKLIKKTNNLFKKKLENKCTLFYLTDFLNLKNNKKKTNSIKSKLKFNKNKLCIFIEQNKLKNSETIIQNNSLIKKLSLNNNHVQINNLAHLTDFYKTIVNYFIKTSSLYFIKKKRNFFILISNFYGEIKLKLSSNFKKNQNRSKRARLFNNIKVLKTFLFILQSNHLLFKNTEYLSIYIKKTSEFFNFKTILRILINSLKKRNQKNIEKLTIKNISMMTKKPYGFCKLLRNKRKRKRRFKKNKKKTLQFFS